MIIGLTGKSCSGKDTVATLLDERFQVIDEDALGHDALEMNRDKLVNAFGGEIIRDGKVDRKKLGPMVFSDPEKLRTLNEITHPWMVEETIRRCREIEKNGRIAVINAAILEEMGFVQYCDQIIYVMASLEKRIERAGMRNNTSREDFLKRAESQKNIGSTLFSSGKKVITIINDEEMEELSRQVRAYCATIKQARVL